MGSDLQGACGMGCQALGYGKGRVNNPICTAGLFPRLEKQSLASTSRSSQHLTVRGREEPRPGPARAT